LDQKEEKNPEQGRRRERKEKEREKEVLEKNKTQHITNLLFIQFLKA